MSKFRSIFSLCIGLFWALPGFCQSSGSAQIAQHTIAATVPEVSLVAVVGSSNVQLQLSKPLEAGQSISAITSNSSVWLNYSFIKGDVTRPKNNIYAKITNGQLPPGTSLSVNAKPYQGTGQGAFGEPSGTVQLSNNASRVIENISSSYTGTGLGNGHQLVYQLSLVPNEYHLLDFESSQEVTILYTIAD